MRILKNPSIPSTMTSDGLDFLGMMARSVPKNGIIVEIGPLFGSSTWVLAKNADPSVQVFSIDTWEPAPWIDKVEAKYRNCKPFSKDAFLYYTRDCPNVTAIQGWSPEVVKDWDQKIDMFFDDATHGDPGFSENVNFFLPFVKENSILCGDDYSSGWPDIVRVVDDLGEKWGVHPEVSGRVWAMRKPTEGGNSKTDIFSSVSGNTNAPQVSVECKTLSGKEYNLSAGLWSGALHKKDRLATLQLNSKWDSSYDMGLEWSIRDHNGETHGPFESGYSHRCSDNEWITGFSVKLTGPDARQHSVDYQGHFCWYIGGGKRYPVSAKSQNGQVNHSDNLKVALAALKINVIPNQISRKNKLKSIFNNFKFLKTPALTKKIISRLTGK